MLSLPICHAPVAFRPPRAAGGFTFLELMVVVLLVAILAAIAYPTYRDQVRKAHRADAQAVLMQAAQFMERYYTENGTYKNAVLPYSKSPIDGTVSYYAIALTVPDDGSSFTVTATPGASESGAAVMSVTDTGRRGLDRNGDGDADDAGDAGW
jgi:type IV pilus assembly protein PilE